MLADGEDGNTVGMRVVSERGEQADCGPRRGLQRNLGRKKPSRGKPVHVEF